MKAAKDDEGFGLIEVVISMLLLAVLAIALLPLLIQGLRSAASNATMATATQVVESAIDAASTVNSCAAIPIGTSATTDARGNALTVTKTRVTTCPTGTTYPNPVLITYSVSVTRTSGGAVLANATTILYIGAP